MDPQVRYCTTTDGLSIGYWSIGGGEAVIDAGMPPTHCEMEWRLAPMRRHARASPGLPTRMPGTMWRCGGPPSSCATSEPSWTPWPRWTSRRFSGTYGRGMQDFKGVTDPLRVYAVTTGST
jgi:hypothetical protein